MPSRLASTSIGPFIWPVASAFRSSSAIAARTGAALTSSALIATTAGSGVPGNASITAIERLDDGSADALDAGLRGVQAERRHRQGEEHRGRGDGRDERAPEDAVEDRRSRCRRRGLRGGGGATNGIRPFSTRSPSFESTAGRTVREPIIATATTSIVPTEKDMNVLSPERNMPAIAIRTVMPETRIARPEVAAAAARAAPSLRPAAPLLALAPDVEERVVDPDGEADQEDHLHDVLVRGDALARERDQAGGGDDRGERRRSSGIIAAVSEPSTSISTRIVSGIEISPALARPPWITASSSFSVDTPTDSIVEAGVARLDLVDGGGDLVDVEDRLLVGALGRELDERRVAVLRDQAGLLGIERRAQRRSTCGNALTVFTASAIAARKAGSLSRQRLRLEQHHLGLLLDALALLVDGEAGVGDDPIGRAGLADVGVVLRDRLRADRHADDDGRRRRRRASRDTAVFQ